MANELNVLIRDGLYRSGKAIWGLPLVGEEVVMSDATGHMDRPGAEPFFTSEAVGGILTGYYTHENPDTRVIEVVKANPPGTPAKLVEEFHTRAAARELLAEEWLSGRLR